MSGQKNKPTDSELVFLDGVVFAAGTTGAVATHDSAAIDLKGDDLDQEGALEVFVDISDAFTGTTNATITLSLIDCDTSGGTYAALTPVQVTTAAIAKADLTGVRTQMSFPLPRIGVRRYLKFRYVIATATVLSGVINAGISKR
jgi:hypothetical protein